MLLEINLLRKISAKWSIFCFAFTLLSAQGFSRYTSEESEASSELSEEESIEKSVGRHARKKFKIRKLKHFLICSNKLIESQYNGEKSSLEGLEFLSDFTTRVQNENYTHRDIYEKCKKKLKSYKKKKAKKTYIDKNESQKYLKKVDEKFKANPNIRKIARKYLNIIFKKSKRKRRFKPSSLYKLLKIPNEINL